MTAEGETTALLDRAHRFQNVKQPRRRDLAALPSPSFAPVVVTTRGGGAPLGAKLVVGSRWLANHRATPSRRAHQRRSFGIGTVLPGAGSTGISPASFRPVQPRDGQPLIVAADGDLLPPGRCGCEPHRAGRRVKLGAAAPAQLRQTLTGRSPGRRSVPLNDASRSAPHGQDDADYSRTYILEKWDYYPCSGADRLSLA